MRRAAFLVWVPLLPLMSVPIAASDFNPFGFYIGGAIGQARDTYSAFGASDATRTGWKALAGVKPIPFFGGEIEYVDFGDATFSAPTGDGPQLVTKLPLMISIPSLQFTASPLALNRTSRPLLPLTPPSASVQPFTRVFSSTACV